MADERKVAVDLEVTRSGETGAFQQTADEIKGLDEAAANVDGLDQLAEQEKTAADAAGELEQGLRGVGSAARQAAEPIAGVGEAAEQTGQKAATGREKLEEMFLKVGASLPVLHEVERALQDVEDGLNKLSEAGGGTGHEFDGLGSKFGAFTASVTQFLNKVGNIDDAFAAFSKTNGGLIDRLKAAQEALDGLSPSAQKLKDTITGTDEKLQAEADAWGEVIRQTENAGEVHEREAERIGSGLAKLAERAKEEGVNLGSSFDALLEKYPQLDEASASRAKAVEDEASAAREAAATQVEALKTVQEAADPASSTVGDTAEKVGDLGTAADTAAGGVTTLATEMKSLPEAASGIQSIFEGLNGITLESLLGAIREIRSEIRGATADAQALQAAVDAVDAGEGQTEAA